MRRDILVFGLACLAACISPSVIPRELSDEDKQSGCRDMVDQYAWVLVFGDLFPLPKGMFLFANSTESHYFEDRNYPRNSGGQASAISVGAESEYRETWLSKDGEQIVPSKTFREGKLTIEIFMRPDGKSVDHVHMTDGREYVALLGPVTQRWRELIDVGQRTKECWKI